jgi:hypothetical protein
MQRPEVRDWFVDSHSLDDRGSGAEEALTHRANLVIKSRLERDDVAFWKTIIARAGHGYIASFRNGTERVLRHSAIARHEKRKRPTGNRNPPIVERSIWPEMPNRVVSTLVLAALLVVALFSASGDAQTYVPPPIVQSVH